MRIGERGKKNRCRWERNISFIIIVVVVFALQHHLKWNPNVVTNGIKAGAKEANKKQGFLKENATSNNFSSGGGKCALEGSTDPPAERIIIDFENIKGMDKGPLERVKDYTTERYVKHLLNDAGEEHYAFLNYMSSTYGDCRHFTDIGTRYVTSSLALGSNRKSPVWTFDLPDSKERKAAFRGKTEEEWQKQVRKNAEVDITFHNLDLMKVSDLELKKYLGTWFVMLDTHHLPDTVPFEREFFQRMLDVSFKGILLLDDIHLNKEMKRWWKELQDNSEKGGLFKTYDVTKVGHYSGTGLVDFSGKVVIQE